MGRRTGRPKKGASPGGWPLIQNVLAAFAPLDGLRPVANRLGRHVQVVRHIAHLFDSESRAAQVKRVVRTYLNRLEQSAPRRGRGAATGHFIDHVVGVADRYWQGLFHAYDHPKIPRTTNALEGFFGTSKCAVRRATGRMSTAGGKFETCGEAIIRTRALLDVMDAEMLAQRLHAVPPEKYRQGKRRLRQLQEPARERRSIQRDPQRFLERILAEWLDTS